MNTMHAPFLPLIVLMREEIYVNFHSCNLAEALGLDSLHVRVIARNIS